MSQIGPALTDSPNEYAQVPDPTTRPNNSIWQQWSDWSGKPENRALLLQAGVNIAQPRAPGQSMVGHIASGIGAGVEAQERNVADQRALEAQSYERANTERTARREEADSESRRALQATQAEYLKAGKPTARGAAGYTTEKSVDDLRQFVELLDAQLLVFTGTDEERENLEAMKDAAQKELITLMQTQQSQAPAAGVVPPNLGTAVAAPSTPPKPASVPDGSRFSAKLQQWQDPQGNLYDAAGTKI